ncbi:MAG: hypothetical protein HRU13_05920 [Phycisphaerales bacterium]|nr:hypothetical protein [Phycisphaerales bacterium]
MPETITIDGPCPLTAYVVSDTTGWVIEPGAPKRDWMDKTPGKGAYRCLPLAIANQAGWVIRCPGTVSMRWTGKDGPDALTVKAHDGPPTLDQFIVSHFGSGIVTFRLPWLFRTPPKIGLMVRGPTNEPKDYAVPLDGFVETDWSPSTFTMNWKIMKRGVDVWFRAGEPICMLQPYPLALLEWTEPQTTPIHADKPAAQAYKAWAESRQQAITRHQGGEDSWQKDYLKGQTAGGTVAPGHHRTRLKLEGFGSG